MFEKFFNRFKKDKTESIPTLQQKQTTLFCVHGFGRRCRHEFDNLVRWGEEDGYNVVTFNMYDLFDENDCDWMMWLQRARTALEQTLKEHNNVVIVGFSMGGVIASYLATLYQPQKLILIAPAFAYISPDIFVHQINNKVNQLLKPKEDDDYDISLPKSFYATFMEIIKQLRKYISKVSCPVLLLHGDQDEVISIKSSYYAYEAIPHQQKRLYMIHGGTHRLLKESPLNEDAYAMIKMFLKDEIICHVPRENCEDVLQALYEEKLRRCKKDESDN